MTWVPIDCELSANLDRLDPKRQIDEAMELVWPQLRAGIEAGLSNTDVTRVLRKASTVEGDLQLTLFGLWRITRRLDGSTDTHQFDVVRCQWLPDSDLATWPSLKLLPSPPESGLAFTWERCLEGAFQQVFHQAVMALPLPVAWQRRLRPRLQQELAELYSLRVLLGNPSEIHLNVKDESQEFPVCLSCFDAWANADTHEEFVERGPKRCLECARREQEAERIAHKRKAFVERLRDRGGAFEHLDLGRSKHYSQQWYAAVRNIKALWKALWHDVIDREVLSLTVRIKGAASSLYLTDVLRVAIHRRDAERIYQERPNWLPFLSVIHPRQWHRDDLFSRRLWVRDGRQWTPVDRSSFRLVRGSVPKSFNSRRVFRFLNRSPHSVNAMILATWRRQQWSRQQAESVIQFLQVVTPSHDPRPFARVIGATAGLIVATSRRLLNGFQPAHERLARAWVQDRLNFWREHGYHALMRSSRAAKRELRDALDWCEYEQGRLPDHNMKWSAIQRRSDEWHQTIHHSTADTERHYTWNSPLDRVESPPLIAEALTDSEALRAEGRALHHCVVLYDHECRTGEYLVFAIRGRNKHQQSADSRATLGLCVTPYGVRIDQVEGPYRQHVTEEVTRFARQIEYEVNLAWQEQAA